MGKEMKRTEQRDEILEKVKQFLIKEYDSDVRATGTGEIMMPAVDSNGEEFYFTFKASIPRGKRNGQGGYTPYNGYEAAEMWEYTLEGRADKEKANAEKKEREAKEKARKAAAKKVVRDLNKKGLDKMIHEEGE